MKKLTIIFKDKSKVIYTIPNRVSYMGYLGNHSRCNIQSAVLQIYPKKDHEPIVLV